MATKAAKERVEQYASLFRPFYGKKLRIEVEPSSIKPIVSTLLVVRPATLVMMKGLEPEKHELDGKFVSPTSMLVEFEDGQLFFSLDDIKNRVINTHGIMIAFTDYRVKFLEVKE